MCYVNCPACGVPFQIGSSLECPICGHKERCDDCGHPAHGTNPCDWGNVVKGESCNCPND